MSVIFTGKKKSENQEQRIKALVARIDELQAERQQLQTEVDDARHHTINVKKLLEDDRAKHQQELNALKAQLAQAQHDLQRSNSCGSNNSADMDTLRQQVEASKLAADDARSQLLTAQQAQDELAAELGKIKSEKTALLESIDQLLKLNDQLRHTLESERQQKVGLNT